MNDILEFVDELKELQELYHTGELRDFDFAIKIAKYERMVEQFEEAMAPTELFRTDLNYNPALEV